MSTWARVFTLLVVSVSLALSEDLPLPKAGPPPSSEPGFLKPTTVIKPPSAGAQAVRAPESAAELAIIEMERGIVEDQTHKLIAEAARTGNSTALKKIILMSGPIDPAISRALKPPTSPANRVAVIGLAPSETVSRSVEQFFGFPVTPDSEKALLEAVKSQMAAKDKSGVDVRIAGWWPKEGVMALSVVPRS
jgi:hypothetical protein